MQNPGEAWRGRSPSNLNPQDRLRRFEENFCEGQLAAREQKFIHLSFCARKNPQIFQQKLLSCCITISNPSFGQNTLTAAKTLPE
ncbi:MAG: hypothetical protein II875_01550 [Clostridia bacterium]|nr:hypothetical protein [Clostridia bacterium]